MKSFVETPWKKTSDFDVIHVAMFIMRVISAYIGIVCGTLVGFTDVLQRGTHPDEEFLVSYRKCMCVEVGS